ncbi:MAG: enoyl-CoA hydratase/isomerase family protein [Xanthobacteraceae bacterium]
MVLHEGEVIVRAERALRRITLNRPQALNALTLDMAVTMTEFLRSWASDPEVGAILIDGAGERGLCAGGDIRALYDAAKSGSTLPERFWSTEYHLNVLIARYPKPVIAVMDGVVMGGGVGVSAHASHRVVTERSAVAMPEVGIGFFPDIGASFLLARAPGHVGTYLALTGDRMSAADAIYCGFADVHIAAGKLAELSVALADCRTAHDVRKQLGRLSSAPAPGRLKAAQPWIDTSFEADQVETIFEELRSSKLDEAISALGTMQKASPTSLMITLRNVQAAASFKRVEESFQQDYRIALACIAGHDFIEGIRATIVDKDRSPKWRPGRLEDVTTKIVDRHFKPVGALELTFPN